MNMRIFDLAAEYNFDAIRNHINAGNPINICDKDGSSLFAAFLNGYARYGDNAEEKEASASHDEHEVSNSFVSAKQKTPFDAYQYTV